MKHKILIDSISLLSPLTGIGRYTYEISKYLQKDANLDVDFFYGYYSKTLLHSSNSSEIKTLKSIISKSIFLKKIARRLLVLSSKVFAPSYELYWQPNFIPNLGVKTNKTIVTVHDFSSVLYKEFHPKERIEYFENNFYKNIDKADIIITVSEFIKKEILNKLDFQENQVKVIYHGVDHDLFRVYKDLNLTINLPQKFIFCAGSIEPRKNLIGLMKAYDSLPSNLKIDYKLVLAGFKGWENNEIMSIINKNKENLIYLGYISDIELAKVYNLASLFVYPSFYEGFGLPLLEAMACGTPVITSNISSLPEVGGDAVLYCNPYDINDIKDKIELVLNDKELQQNMIKNGLKRAKTFNWNKSAQEHIKIFKAISG